MVQKRASSKPRRPADNASASHTSTSRRRPADRGRASRRIYQNVSDKRSVLAHLDLAKRSAKASLTRRINQARISAGVPSNIDGGALKRSVLAMADAAGADSETYRILDSMDEGMIARMYQDNSLTFEVYFNYEGMEDRGGFRTVSEQKQTDIDFFISQYSRYEAAGL